MIVQKIVNLVESGLHPDQYELVDWLDFCSKHTLHDSYWEHFWVETKKEGEVYAIINWDTHWQGPRIKNMFGDNQAYLLVRFDGVTKMELSGFSAHEYNVHNCIGSESLDDNVLTITSIAGASISISPVQEVAIILMDSDLQRYSAIAQQGDAAGPPSAAPNR